MAKLEIKIECDPQDVQVIVNVLSGAIQHSDFKEDMQMLDSEIETVKEYLEGIKQATGITSQVSI